MGLQSIIKSGETKRLILLAGALLSAALTAIPASNVALAQGPAGRRRHPRQRGRGVHRAQGGRAIHCTSHLRPRAGHPLLRREGSRHRGVAGGHVPDPGGREGAAGRLGAHFPVAYVRLLSVKNTSAREFYGTEALRGGWSVRQLDRQINSQFYERTALSKNKAAMLTEGPMLRHGDRVEIKDPFVLEVLDLKDEYSESDLEEALIRHLETFLLELGGDFCFMGRQRRLRIGDKWFRVDLLFFHRRLRCLVVIDLKIGAFTHADAGQMHLYLNYAREHWVREEENPPVGLVLCSQKDEALARYALDGLPNNMMAAEYRITLPNEELLAAEIDRTRQMIESRGSITSEAPLSSGTLTVENPKE